MTRSKPSAVALTLLLSLFVPGLALAGEAPPPGDCGSLRGEVVPVGPLSTALKCTNCFVVRLVWDAAAQLDYDGVEGYYGVKADWGEGLESMPFSPWDRRSLTYDWGIDWKEHRDGKTGKDWTFQVGAFRDNAKADGPKSTVSVYVPGALAAPGSPSGTRTEDGVKLTWTAPAGRAGSGGGAPVSIEKYVVIRLDQTATGTVEKTVGEPTSTDFTDPIQDSRGLTYYVYPVDQFGVGRSANAFVPESDSESPSDSPAQGCSTAGAGAGSGLAFLALAGFALLRSRHSHG
ncbi:MAG: MYXO-CTERM sorting domain-containing protein [Myxococcales bacterium]